MAPSSLTTIFSLVLLPSVLLFPNIVMGDEDLIQKTCQSTQYPDLCLSTVHSDPSSQSADAKGLAVIVINTGNSNAIDTSSYISNELLKTAPAGSPLQIALQNCTQEYNSASESFEGSLRNLAAGKYEYAAVEMTAATDYPHACGNVFKGTPGVEYPDELKKREETLANLCVVATGIINLISH